MTKLEKALLAAEGLKKLEPQIKKLHEETKDFGKDLEARARSLGFTKAELALMGFK